MPEINTRADNVRLVGERLCLHFVNTVDDHRKAQPKEYLHSYAELVGWSAHVGILTTEAAHTLRAEAAQRPAEAVAVLQRGLMLRGALFRIFAALAAASPPPLSDLDVLNGTLIAAPYRARVALYNGRIEWAWPTDPTALDRPLWLVAWSAADVLTSSEATQVRECAGEGCSWLFLDTSRSGARRWCAMEDCGNRAKARRHYAHRRRHSTG